VACTHPTKAPRRAAFFSAVNPGARVEGIAFSQAADWKQPSRNVILLAIPSAALTFAFSDLHYLEHGPAADGVDSPVRTGDSGFGAIQRSAE
jgi:hypothetical protein